MPLWLLREFLRLEAAAGFLLLGAAALALILANTPLAWLYHDLLDIPVVVQVGALKISKPLLLWINDGGSDPAVLLRFWRPATTGTTVAKAAVQQRA